MIAKANQRGIGILQAVISISVLAIVVVAISYFITSSKRQLVVEGGNAACSALAQNIIDQIGGIGVRDNILPPFTSMNDFTGADIYLNHSAFGAIKDKLSTTQYFSRNIVEPVLNQPTRISNSHLILSSVSFLEALYNSDLRYCSQGHSIPNGLIPSASINELPGAVVQMQIQPVVLSTNQVNTSCPFPLYTSPRGLEAPAQTYRPHFIGDSDAAYKVIVSVQYLEQGVAKGCQAHNVYQHQDDRNPPPAASQIQIRTQAGVTLQSCSQTDDTISGSQCTSCNTDGAGFNTVNITSYFDRWEPGSVFICRDNSPSSVDRSWKYCANSQLGGIDASGFLIASNPNQITLTLTFENLAGDREYKFEVGAVDTAGNISDIQISANPNFGRFYIDNTRPTVSSLAEVAGHIGQPEDGLNGRERLPAPFSGANWSRSAIQCNAEPLGFAALYSDGGGLTHNFVNCVASSDLGVNGTSWLGTGCFIELNASTHGLHSVTATAADSCGSGGSLTENWATSLTPPAVSNAGHFSFDNNNTATTNLYPVVVPTNTVPAPNNFVVACDCNSPPLVDGDTQCTTNEIAPTGCYRPPGANNFQFQVYDICGRSTPMRFASYEVHGDEGDICGNISCKSGLICVRPNDDGYTTSLCRAPDNNPICTDPQVGIQNTTCPSEGLYSCSYNGLCSPSATDYCASGSRSGDNCSFSISGTCSAALVCDFTCPAGAASCTAGACSAAGASCTVTVSGNCESPLNGQCDSLGEGPFSDGVRTNPACPVRGPQCGSSVACVPTCPASNTYCSGLEPADGCGGVCPAGSKPGCGCTGAPNCDGSTPVDTNGNPCPITQPIPSCGCPDATTYCSEPGQPGHPTNSAGQACPIGIRPGCGCPDTSTYCPSELQSDSLGRPCPAGTKDCGSGCASPSTVCEGLPTGGAGCPMGTKCCETCPPSSSLCQNNNSMACGAACPGDRPCTGSMGPVCPPCYGYCCSRGMCYHIKCR